MKPLFSLLFLCCLCYSCGTSHLGKSVTPNNYVVVQSGQSNAWGASGATAFDTAANPRVLVWQHAQYTPAWVTAHINQRPFRTLGYNSLDGTGYRNDLNGSANSAFYFAKKMAAEHPNDTIRIILAIGDGQSIVHWFSQNKPGKYLDSLTARCQAAGIKKVNVLLWDQGEADTYMPEEEYLNTFRNIKTTLRLQPYFPTYTPIIAAGLASTHFGAKAVFVGKDSTLQKLATNNDPWDSYVSADSLFIANDSVHFSGGALDTLAGRYYKKYKALVGKK